MVNKALTVALVNSILQVLDQVSPNCVRRGQPRCCGRWGVVVHRHVPMEALDLDWLHQIRGDPGAGPSSQEPTHAPNPRVRVLERPPSPSP
jgi:hypothetical protein